MRFGDFFWLLILGSIFGLFFYPVTQGIVISVTKSHPYVMGFLKFSILATMGELLAIRIVIREWGRPPGLIYRSIVWGLIGSALVVIFGIFATGVVALINNGLLPTGGIANSNLMTALWISIINNLAFGPTLMLFHRITDTYLDLAKGQITNLRSVSLLHVANEIDWKVFLNFIVFKTIPFFWIPAHTVTFLLPPEYRILFAAFLSIALGAISGFAKSGSTQKTDLSLSDKEKGQTSIVT